MSLVAFVDEKPIAGFVRVTLTSATTAPDWSVTTPVTLELSWAFAGNAASTSTSPANTNAARNAKRVRLMRCPPSCRPSEDLQTPSCEIPKTANMQKMEFMSPELRTPPLRMRVNYYVFDRDSSANLLWRSY